MPELAVLTPQTERWRLARAYASRRPIRVSWQVTYHCNARCGFRHCWKDPMGLLPEQTIDQFKSRSRKLAGLGTLLVSLAGGEPLLRRNLPDIVRAVARWHVPLLTTHGGLVTSDMAEEKFTARL